MAYSDEQILTLSPFSVIMMMSVADGGNQFNLDRAVQLIEKLNEDLIAIESRLLWKKVQEFLKEIDLATEAAKTIRSNPIKFLSPLGKVRGIVDKLYPDEAEDFCHGLVELGRVAATHMDPDGSSEMTGREKKGENFLKVMLLDSDPLARAKIASILEILCLGLEKRSSDKSQLGASPSTQLQSTATIAVDQQVVLDRGPGLVFALVAAADGKVDKKEMAVFAKILAAAKSSTIKSPALGRSLDIKRSCESVDHYIKTIANGSDPQKELEILCNAIDGTLSALEAQQFKLGLAYIGKQVAEASGGYSGSFGSNDCKKEKAVLGSILVALKIV